MSLNFTNTENLLFCVEECLILSTTLYPEGADADTS